MFIITGGGSGIGQALALTLAGLNQKILIVGRTEEALVKTAQKADTIDFIAADVSTSEGRASVLARIESEQSISGLIHNAGIIEPIAPIKKLQEKDWQQAFKTNVEAPLFLTQALLPQLTGGRVLNISSGAAHFPVSGWSAYCTSKAALSMLTQCFQIECPKVAFASVMPGIIDTPMQHKIRHADHMTADKRDFFIELKEKQQLISPETVAQFLGWLLLKVSTETFSSQEWDIYDTNHHSNWLKYPHNVPPLEG